MLQKGETILVYILSALLNLYMKTFCFLCSFLWNVDLYRLSFHLEICTLVIFRQELVALLIMGFSPHEKMQMCQSFTLYSLNRWRYWHFRDWRWVFVLLYSVYAMQISNHSPSSGIPSYWKEAWGAERKTWVNSDH